MDWERYARQIPVVGEEGQARLATSDFLVVGAGGLVSPILYALVGAGVGKIRILDPDVVAISNLNRQFLHREEDVGREKVVSAAEKLSAFNSAVQIEPIAQRLTAENAQGFLKGMDLAVLAVDNLEARLTMNAACVALSIPFIEGGIDCFSGLVMAVEPGVTPCLACVQQPGQKPKTPSSLGAMAGIIGAMEATLAIQLLLGMPNSIANQLLFFDALDFSLEAIPIFKDPECKICGRKHHESHSFCPVDHQ